MGSIPTFGLVGWLVGFRWGMIVVGGAVWGWAWTAAGQDPGALVEVKRVIPDIIVELPYATRDNFTGKPLYRVERCYLRRNVADRLKAAADELRAKGYRIKIWDGYRPLAVQREMWKAVPDPRYVGSPARGSRHNRGAAVDLTLTDLEGKEVVMPTPYDTFSSRAHAYALLTDGPGQEAMKHRKILQEAMRNNGFQVMKTEWWHFDAVNWQVYPVLDVPLEEVEKVYPPEKG